MTPRTVFDRVDPGDEAELGALIALSTLRFVGPSRLRWMRAGRSAHDTLTDLRQGRIDPAAGPAPAGVRGDMVTRWATDAKALDPDALLAAHRAEGWHVLMPGHRAWPFVDDPEPPAVLYVKGRLDSLTARHRVAIVGTRRCTDVGRLVATELGRDLAACGVTVVSGLALGIDGAAHRGALAAAQAGSSFGAPLAVVANGLDRISPPSHRRLAAAVADCGAVISETPLGTNIDRWRFPARNRLIAGLSQVVVVVESHERGGALITVDEANDRGVTVMSVPGSVRSAASAGTNRLLIDGAAPACSATDVVGVLEGLGLGAVGEPAGVSPADVRAPVAGVRLLSIGIDDPLERRIVNEIGAMPLTIDRLVEVTEAGLGAVVLAVARLAGRGVVRQVGATVSVSG